MCLSTDNLFLSYPFARTGPPSPSAVTALPVPLDSTTPLRQPTRPPNLQFMSPRSLASDCHTGPASSYKSLLFLFELLHPFLREQDPPGPALEEHPSPAQLLRSFRQILPGLTAFFFGSQFHYTFLSLAFLLFHLPFKSDISLPQNPATSIPIPDPCLLAGYPPDDCPQISDFILVLFFQFVYGKR